MFTQYVLTSRRLISQFVLGKKGLNMEGEGGNLEGEGLNMEGGRVE